MLAVVFGVLVVYRLLSGHRRASTSARTSASPRTCKSPAKFRDVHTGNYRSNCVICKIFGPRAVSKEYHLGATNLVSVAQRYASKVFGSVIGRRHLRAAFQGLLIRGQPSLVRWHLREAHAHPHIARPGCDRGRVAKTWLTIPAGDWETKNLTTSPPP